MQRFLGISRNVVANLPVLDSTWNADKLEISTIWLNHVWILKRLDTFLIQSGNIINCRSLWTLKNCKHVVQFQQDNSVIAVTMNQFEFSPKISYDIWLLCWSTKVIITEEFYHSFLFIASEYKRIWVGNWYIRGSGPLNMTEFDVC